MASPLVQQLLPQLVMSAPQLLPLLSAFSQNPTFQPFSNVKSETGKESKENERHHGVVCDVCEAPISGVRYKCTTCVNYDLCSQCEAKPGAHDPSHMLLKIQKPLNAHGSGRGCPYMRPRNVNNNNESFRPWNRGCRRTAQQSGFLSRFVQDVTIPDGSEMNVGQKFVKIWRLRNEGEIAWPEGTYLLFVGGDKLCAQEEIPVPVAAPGSEVDISVDMVAPTKSGRYVSYWRLCNSDGSRFGQRVWLDIYVQDAQQDAPELAPSSSQATQTQQALSMEVETQTINPSSSSKSTATTVTSNEIGTSTDAQPLKENASTNTMIQSVTSPEVQQLLDMGFNNADLLQHLVTKHDGDMVQVVQEVLGMQ